MFRTQPQGNLSGSIRLPPQGGGPVEYGKNWDAIEGFFTIGVEEELYRDTKGFWTLLKREIHYLATGDWEPDAIRLSAKEAARWISENGFELPADLSHHENEFAFQPGEPLPREEMRSVSKPKWDSQTRELRYGEILCKRFRQQAGNQVTILNAFEEEGWPPRIDDPLRPKTGSDNEQRLRDAVKGLNKNKGGIKFELDGTGTGILWHPTESPHASPTTDDILF